MGSLVTKIQGKYPSLLNIVGNILYLHADVVLEGERSVL